MPDFAGLQFHTFLGDLVPAVGQLTLSTSPLVVNTTRARAVESKFESVTECQNLAAALALMVTYRGLIGAVTMFRGAAVFIADVDCDPMPMKDGSSTCSVVCQWLLYASPDWLPDA